MKRALPALLLLATALLGTAACDNAGSGESSPPATETQVPAPVPT